ncbi:MAG: metal-dependent hydrolase [Candidatus Nanohaloarchaea archaeon]
MGDFSEHVLFGFLFAAVSYYFLSSWFFTTPAMMVAAVAAVFVGSVLPDIDHRKSYVHRSAKAFTSISAGISVLLFAPVDYRYRFVLAVIAVLLIYSAIAAVKLRHRGVTHSISFCLAVTAAMAVTGVYAAGSAIPGLALGTGLFSHLLLDRELKL